MSGWSTLRHNILLYATNTVRLMGIFAAMVLHESPNSTTTIFAHVPMVPFKAVLIASVSVMATSVVGGGGGDISSISPSSPLRSR